MKKNKWFLGLTAMSAAVALAACGGDSSSSDGDNLGKINLAYVEWDTEVASTHVVGQVLEEIGYDVTLTPLDNAIMWESVSKGEADAMVAGWLPATHGAQLEKYGDQVEHLGENLKGAKIGLVVPSYMEVSSIDDLTVEASSTITGIEAGAGVMSAAETALADYPNLADWSLLPSSSGAMTVALDQAIANNEEIIVTGWSPHWKFASYDLKYLEDPKGSFGGEETINTFTRQGLKDDAPEAYKVLDAFEWAPEDIEEVMLAIHDGQSPKDAANDWIEKNRDKVDAWTKDVK
ncbi:MULTISPECIES: glycine betaine ABC transporter substrate-binding protein [Bacillales]|uniref:Glycine betaine ABC transporter substrate-binding protein n=1 Tax=Lysinibacillus louembei TaxID=1470088 RepID=A0ABZ0RVZ7_9BACI|nr:MULTISPECIES: glycine betaine ABC transporter substrate-binding protein [Bacillales]MCT6924973.1 glycine betaine ABC transporter substrate-binding protein [Metasolibacillus sp.]MCT6942361.1 glycine betaine ABC transporter substrate-binding protein [Metasolibacillus sp.]WPK11224.1 glycine betaine ABC transporter substrate-binding protein [Lysinibacillus louembei]